MTSNKIKVYIEFVSSFYRSYRQHSLFGVSRDLAGDKAEYMTII